MYTIAPKDLVPGMRYRLRSLSTTDLIPPVSGIFKQIVSKSAIVTDKSSNTKGFIVSPHHTLFLYYESIIPLYKLVPGQTYTLVSISKNKRFPPTKVIFLGLNDELLFTDVDIGDGVYIPERKINSHTIQISHLPTDVKYGFAPYTSPDSSAKNSKNTLRINSFFTTTRNNTKKNRRAKRRQNRIKSSRSRKYI